jgi:citrate lyase subunit beta/citryl-CoA lyase
MLNKMITILSGKVPDAFVPDLEDSVPMDSKDQARSLVKQFIREEYIPAIAKREQESLFCPLLIPRINVDISEQCLFQDIHAVVTERTDALTFGKAESADNVNKISLMLDQIEKERNLPPKSIKLIPWIETALGIVNAYPICKANPDRLIAVAFGGDDYANSMGFTRNTSQNVERELEYPRSVIAVAANAAKVLSLDTPNVNFKDTNSIIEESNAVKQLGFKGKFAIHPNQIQPLNEIFGISQKEYEYAKRIVDAYNEAASQQGGKRGSTQVDGRMIDTPVFKTYQQVLERAELLSKRK